MIELTLEFNPELSDRCNFAAFVNANFGTTLTADDLGDVIAMGIEDGKYNTEVIIDLPNVGEQILHYNRVDFNTLIETDHLIGVDNPGRLRDALETQFGIVVGPRDLGIDASKRKDGLLGVTMLGTLCLTGSKAFKLRPVLSRAITRPIGAIQIVPTGASKDVPEDIAALPYLAGIKASTNLPKVFETPTAGSVSVVDTFDGLAYGFHGAVVHVDQEVRRYGYDTIMANFVFQAVIQVDDKVEGSLSMAIGLGTSAVMFKFTDEFINIGNASYPTIRDTLLNIRCVGRAGVPVLDFFINDRLVTQAHINELPTLQTEGITMDASHLSGINLYECGIKGY